MSLIVDHQKVNPPLTEDERPMIFNVGITMACLGIRKLEMMSDLYEILFRARFYNRLNGPILKNKDGEALEIRKEFWDRWAGVSANVNPEKRAAWVKRMVQSALADIEYTLRDEL